MIGRYGCYGCGHTPHPGDCPTPTTFFHERCLCTVRSAAPSLEAGGGQLPEGAALRASTAVPVEVPA